MAVFGSRGSYVAISIVAAVSSFVALYIANLYNYLLFHTIAELFSVVIACTIFIIYLNTHENISTSLYSVIGPVYLFTAVLDFLHTLSYSGMNIFIGYGANLPTSLWIAARYLESFGLLAGFLLIRSKPKKGLVLTASTFVFTGSVIAIFTGVFPACYVDGAGLTTFKVASEYIICAVLFVSILLCYFRRPLMDDRETVLLISACVITIAAELSFTLYSDPFGFFNLVGHYLKIVSYCLIYLAIVSTGLLYPYLELREKEKLLTSLLVEKNVLLKELHHRVKNNLQNIISLMQLQTGISRDAEVSEQINMVVRRVKSIGIIHEMMYHNQNLGRISCKQYLASLNDTLFQHFPDKRDTVEVHTNGEDLLLSLDDAVPVALFINELITSSMKNAFPNGIHGRIEVEINDKKEEGAEIIIRDNGVDRSVDSGSSEEENMIMGLVRSLVKQVNGKLSIEALPAGGTVHTITMTGM